MSLLALTALCTVSIGGWLFNRSSRASQKQNTSNIIVPSGVKPNLPLLSVLPRAKDVFASNEEGIFRVLREEMRWQRLPIPDTMPLNGYFVHLPPTATDIFYFTPRLQNEQKTGSKGKKAFGLYRSRDNGQGWQLLSQDYNFRHVFLHPVNGALYAIVETTFALPKLQKSGSHDARSAQRAGIRQNVLMSRDMGHTWRDITGALAQQNIQLFGIFADSDNPELVCLNAWSTRGYILQANSEDYNWEMTVDSAWRKDHETDESFFSRYYGTKSTLYMHQATLNNYFQYEFGEEVDLPAFDIVPEQMEYTFPQDGEKVIKFSVQFLPASPAVKLLDTEVGSVCWSARFIGPSGKRADAGQSAAGLNRTNFYGQMQSAPNYEVINLANSRPYSRSLDLAQLCTFSEKGTYRLQLLYDNTRIPGDLRGRWAGFFASRIFTVTIT